MMLCFVAAFKLSGIISLTQLTGVGSTRVLVTHQRQYLPACDRLLVLRHGRVAAAGTFDELAGLGMSELHNPAGAQHVHVTYCMHDAAPAWQQSCAALFDLECAAAFV
jgi:ABC-type multidrug transport system ATPase subunit